jgi:hypothetical protein
MPRGRRLVSGFGAVLALLALKVAFTHVGSRGDRPHAVHGAYHVHSTYSDGQGTVAQIAAAARRDGLDFVVLTDHNVLNPSAGGVIDGVLIVSATEESTAHGHVISLGASRALNDDEKERGGHGLRRIRDLGGVPLLAHPYNRRNPFTDWTEVGVAAGLETLSYDDLWREAVHDPLGRGLLVGALELPFNPRLAVAQLIRRPSAELLAFDALRQSTDLAQLCAVDAHGLPAYAPVLGTMSMYLDDLPPGPLDPRLVAERLESGRAYCTLDVIGSGAGFGFKAVAAGTEAFEGMKAPFAAQSLRIEPPAPPLPKGVEAHLFRDGVDLGVVPVGLGIPAAGPGDYRVEIWAPLPGAFYDGPLVPWILSNAIRLQ